MKAYSRDLRERIARAVARGRQPVEVALAYEVSLSTVKRYDLAVRRGESLAPKPRPGRPRAIPPQFEPLLVAQVEAHPDDTLEQHAERWAQATGVRLSLATLCRAVKRAGLPRKKDAARG